MRIAHDGVVAPVMVETSHTSNNNTPSPSLMMMNMCFSEDQQTLEDLRDVIHALKAKEASYHRLSSTSSASSSSTTTNGSTSSFPLYFDTWRPVMVSWMYSVVDTFALNPLCVPTGMYYLDTCCRTLSSSNSGRSSKKELYPLMAMTSLNLAIKCHETRMFPLDQLVLLLGRGKQHSGGQEGMRYTPQDIVDMERQLLKACRWKLHPTTTHDFLHQFVQVLEESHREDSLERSLTHLKNALAWEHVLHQQQEQQQSKKRSSSPVMFQPFVPSTLAYASLLLAMEDQQLPLADKQACCLALLQVADMSTHTPHLSQAYNWLVYAKNLQAQLVAADNQKRQDAATSPVTPAAATTRVVSPTTTATVSTGDIVPEIAPAATKADFQPPRGSTDSSAPVAVVSPATSTATTTLVIMEDASNDANGEEGGNHSMMLVEETTVVLPFKAASQSQQHHQHFRHPSVVVDEDDEGKQDQDASDFLEEDETGAEDELREVIFYSHTYTGDGFEVMAIDMMDDHDAVNVEMADHIMITTQDPATITTHLNGASACEEASFLASPSSTEISVADLILTESLDEDGFEVSYGDKQKELLANMLASPTNVVVGA